MLHASNTFFRTSKWKRSRMDENSMNMSENSSALHDPKYRVYVVRMRLTTTSRLSQACNLHLFDLERKKSALKYIFMRLQYFSFNFKIDCSYRAKHDVVCYCKQKSTLFLIWHSDLVRLAKMFNSNSDIDPCGKKE